MTGHAALPPEDPTPPDGFPTPPTGVPAASAESVGSLHEAVSGYQAGTPEEPVASEAETVRTATPRRLQAVPDSYPTVVSGPRTGAFGRPIGKHRPTALQRLVEVARVLVGGLMVLTLAVIVAPLVLAASGPGIGVLVGHVVGAVIALAATGVAAWRRTPVWAATVAALVVPIVVLVVLAVFWWR
jgi:lipopolysaccharide export LptBFGC system permease protein LptF